jgi:hypothetical protein
MANTLFGPTPEDLQRQYYNDRQSYLDRASQLGPSQSAGAAIGTLLGGIVGSIFGVENPELKRAKQVEAIKQEAFAENPNLSDEATLYSVLADKFAQRGLPNYALEAKAYSNKLAQEASKLDLETRYKESEIFKNTAPKEPTISDVARKVQDYRTALAEGRTEDAKLILEAINTKPEQTAMAESDRAIRNKFITKFGPEKGEEAFQQYKVDQDVTKGKATVPPPEGGSTTVDVSRLSTDFGKMVTPFREKLDSVNEALDVAELAKTSPQATVQVDKALAKLMDKGLVSNKDFKDIQNAGSLPSSLANRVSKIFNGTDASATYDDKVKVLQTFQTIAAKRNNEAVDTFTALWGTTPMGQKSVEAITKGAKFNTGRTSPAKSAIPFVNAEEEAAFRAWQAKKRTK